MARKSAWFAISNHKCPRCREGDIFKYSLLQKPGKFTETHQHCPHCNLRFEREPGFFYGAMYVSYALTMAILLGLTFMLYFFFGDPSAGVYIATVTVSIVLFVPVVFRYSRTLYLHVFGGVKYSKEYEGN